MEGIQVIDATIRGRVEPHIYAFRTLDIPYFTKVGDTFPYGLDPRDRNIRIAPSIPPVEELELAMRVFSVCIRLAALERLSK